MMELYSLSRALKSDFTTDIYCLNTMCDQWFLNLRAEFSVFFFFQLKKSGYKKVDAIESMSSFVSNKKSAH